MNSIFWITAWSGRISPQVKDPLTARILCEVGTPSSPPLAFSLQLLQIQVFPGLAHLQDSVAPRWLTLEEFTFGPSTLKVALDWTLEVEGGSIALAHPSHQSQLRGCQRSLELRA